MSSERKELYEFDNFCLDISERILWREGERVPLSEKAFDTLCALVRHGDHLVSRCIRQKTHSWMKWSLH